MSSLRLRRPERLLRTLFCGALAAVAFADQTETRPTTAAPPAPVARSLAPVVRPEAPLSTPVPARGEIPAGGWWDDVFVERTATLGEVLANPESFRGRIVRFAVQFARTTKPVDVYHTSYTPDRWLNVVAWPDEAVLQDAASFRAEHAFFFMSRDHAEAAALAAAPQYSRFALRARVVEVLKGAPWIEILSATPLAGRMTEAALLRLVKAAKLQEHRKFEAAADELGLADDAGLPTAVRVRLLRERAACLGTAKRFHEAAAALKDALTLRPDEPGLAGDYAAMHARIRGRAPAPENGERPASVVESKASESRPKPASRPTR